MRRRDVRPVLRRLKRGNVAIHLGDWRIGDGLVSGFVRFMYIGEVFVSLTNFGGAKTVLILTEDGTIGSVYVRHTLDFEKCSS
jgi:hypothetical protein